MASSEEKDSGPAFTDFNLLSSVILWAILPNFGTPLALRFLYQYGILTRPSSPEQGQAHTTRVRGLLIVGYLCYEVFKTVTSLPVNHYQILGVPVDIDEDGVRAAFRKLARIYHPDKIGPAGEAMFMRLRLAMDTLSKGNGVKRHAYDRFGPSSFEWSHAVTLKEHMLFGIKSRFVLHAAQYGIWSGFQWLSGNAMLSYWRLVLLGLLFSTELWLLSQSGRPTFLRWVAPGFTQYELCIVMHQCFVSAMLAGQHLANLLPQKQNEMNEPKTLRDAKMMIEVLEARSAKLEQLAALCDKETEDALADTVRPLIEAPNTPGRPSQETVKGAWTSAFATELLRLQLEAQQAVQQVFAKRIERRQAHLAQQKAAVQMANEREKADQAILTSGASVSHEPTAAKNAAHSQTMLPSPDTNLSKPSPSVAVSSGVKTSAEEQFTKSRVSFAAVDESIPPPPTPLETPSVIGPDACCLVSTSTKAPKILRSEICKSALRCLHSCQLRGRMIPMHHSRSSLSGSGVYGPSPVTARRLSSMRNAPGRKQWSGITSLTVDTTSLDVQSGATPVRTHTRIVSGSAHAASLSTSQKAPPKSRWKTPEFFVYYAVVIVAVIYMITVAVRLSQVSHPNFPRYASHLVPGWIFGRMRDNSDFQYRTFREFLLPLSAVLTVYLGLSHAFASLPELKVGLTATTSPRRNRRIFLFTFTAIFVLALHGTNTIKLILVCWANYALSRRFGGSRLATPTIWCFNVCALFLIHYNNGFSYRQLGEWLAPLDRYTGLLPRWQINFNITMLRLVSFALDFHWARTADLEGCAVRQHGPSAPLDARQRSATSRRSEEYSFTNYLLYALYPPLFIAGPIMTFNDFMSQMHQPVKVTPRLTVAYLVRFIASLLTMEIVLHFIYVNAIKDAHAWAGTTAMELSMIGFWNLIIVWLKLLLPWRFFRLWAMADGVDAPENMVRCMANNYSTLGFWRSWHRSYNLWIVRYIYIPVGGGSNALPATLLVFTFVALWHDLSLKLLTWGWLVTLFLAPELAARALFPPSSTIANKPWFRHVGAFAGALNVVAMMTANLVGFAIGLDGTRYMWNHILNQGFMAAWTFLGSVVFVLFCAVQLMMEYRADEARLGINRKC